MLNLLTTSPLGRLFSLTTIIVGLSACGNSQPEGDASAPRVPHTLDAQLVRTHTQVNMVQEWRDAREVSGADPILIPLDAPAPGARILIEILDASGHPATVTLRDATGHAIQTMETPGNGRWNDVYFRFMTYIPHEILIDSDSAFSIGKIDSITKTPAPKPDVIVILVDTLRADHLGVYGYKRNTSPNIDAFAKDAILFTEYVSQTSWTRTAIASLLTSAYPNLHGALDRGDVVRDTVDWLPVTLQQAGYDTDGIITNPNCLPIWGFGKGFRRYVDVDSQDWFASDDANAVQKAIDFLDTPSSKPRFQFIHLLSPHSPYLAKEPYKTQLFRPRQDDQSDTDFDRQNTVDLYDSEIAYADAQVGKYLDHLRANDRYDNSLIVFLSDHGEEFWEHGGTSHGLTLYDEQLKVPFIVKLPGNKRAGTRYEHIVETVDVAPSILEYVGIESPARFQGASFVSAVNANEPYKAMAYTSLRLDQKSMEATQTTNEKLIFDLSTQNKEWFNLTTDPGELNPLTQSPLDPDPLLQHIQKMSRDGAEGLHILITHDSKKAVHFSGTISGVSSFDLNYPEELSTTDLSDDTLTFTLNMPEADDPFLPSTKWRKSLDDPMMRKLVMLQRPDDYMTEMDFAEIIIPATFTDEFQIDIQLEGTAIPEERVHLGGIGHHASATGLQGRAVEWIVPPFAISLESLPRETNLYIWHVPPADAIADEDLDPELEEALRGLGYID